MMYSVEYLYTAKKDLHDIIVYINTQLKNKNAATKFINAFEKEINNISSLPYSNPEYYSNKKLLNKYRYAKVKNFLIFYIVEEEKKKVIISRIIYKKRDLNHIIN